MQAAPQEAGTATAATGVEPATSAATTEHPGVSAPQPREADSAALAAAEAHEARTAAATEAFARGHEELTDEDEQDALDFLLAPKPARLYDVTVQYDTPKGVRPLTFVIRGMDGRRIDAIEQANVSETTGKIDAISAECQLVAEGCVFLEGRPGHQVKLDSAEYLTVRQPDPEAPDGFRMVQLASPAMAIEARFKTQLGLIAGVASAIRQISGYDPRRVGNAQRRLAGAVGNS